MDSLDRPPGGQMSARNKRPGLEALAYRELSPTERVYVSIDRASGEPLLDVRCWSRFTKVTGDFWPTKRGLSFTADELGELIERLQEVRATLGASSRQSRSPL
jgi:hypothetical protein